MKCDNCQAEVPYSNYFHLRDWQEGVIEHYYDLCNLSCLEEFVFKLRTAQPKLSKSRPIGVPID